MSNALALAGVSAVLQYYFNEVYNAPASVFGTVTLSAVAPDIIQNTLGSGSNSQLQVNLFLHQVTHNPSWRNMELPSLAADGITLLKNPPLALDLHYLLTAYGSENTHAEALLGYGILMLHENPIIARADIRTALSNLPPGQPFASVLAQCGLADQIEMIKIMPATMGKEELAWLWTALKADYRPTFPFDVSVVLIQPDRPSTFAIPVLSRDITIQAGPPPQLLSVQPPKDQSAAAQGDTVTLIGQSLAGAGLIALSNPRLGIQYAPFAPATGNAGAITFVVPTDPANLPAGHYNVSVLFEGSQGSVVGSSNSLPIWLAPSIPSPPTVTITTNASGTLVTIGVAPAVLPNQTVYLALNGTSAAAQTFETASSTLSFQFPTLAAGQYLARLQVDGVPSQIGVNWNLAAPAFTGPYVTV